MWHGLAALVLKWSRVLFVLRYIAVQTFDSPGLASTQTAKMGLEVGI